MKVFLDISPVTANAKRRSGLARTAIELASSLQLSGGVELVVGAFGSVNASVEVHNYLSGEGADFDGYVECSEFTRRLASGVAEGRFVAKFFGRLWNYIRSPYPRLDTRKLSVTHSIYARFPLRSRCDRIPKVITIHDLTPLIFPEHLFQPGQRGITRRIIDSVKPDDFVICPSEATRRDFLNWTHHPESRCEVIPWGVNTELFYPNGFVGRECDGSIFRKRYILTLSSLAKHKNIEFLVRCFSKALESVATDDRDCVLVLAGNSSKETVEALKSNAPSQHRDHLHFPGYVTDDKLAALFSSAEAFMFPSLYEGFGLPVLEAMACGCPVVVSDRGSLPEVCGPKFPAFDPTDEEPWINEIAAFLRGKRSSPNQNALDHAKKFSWTSVANSHLSVYRSLHQN